MCLIIASVPHTGSHFLIDLTGYTVLDDPENISRAVERNLRVYCFRHVYGGESIELLTKWGKMAPLISPLRHPMSVAQSWKNRGKPIFEIEQRASMIKLFHKLIDLSKAVKIHFLPLDLPNKQRYLDRICEVAKRRLKTNWVRFGPSDTKPHIPLTEADIEAVGELMTDPFFEPFYDQHPNPE